MDKHEESAEAEVQRLTGCLHRANAYGEEYERRYYLEVNVRENVEARAERLKREADKERKASANFLGQLAAASARAERLEAALRSIAECHSQAPGDVVAVARKALAATQPKEADDE